jgi:hypothetical protein
MKYIKVLIVFLILFIGNLFGKDFKDQNTFMVFLNGSFSFDKWYDQFNDRTNVYYYYLSPQIGYFIYHNLAFCLSTNISYSYQHDFDTTPDTIQNKIYPPSDKYGSYMNISIGSSLRYYFLKYKPFNFYTSLGAGLKFAGASLSNSLDRFNYFPVLDYTNSGFYLSLGTDYLLFKRVLLESDIKLSPFGESLYTLFSINIGIGTFF